MLIQLKCGVSLKRFSAFIRLRLIAALGMNFCFILAAPVTTRPPISLCKGSILRIAAIRPVCRERQLSGESAGSTGVLFVSAG